MRRSTALPPTKQSPVSPGFFFARIKLYHYPESLKLDRTNPLSALLLAGTTDALRASNWLALGLNVQEDTLVFEAVADGKAVDPAGPTAFALPSKPEEGARPNLAVPRRIAALSFYRDLHRFYAAKDDLFPERTSELIFFENMMGIFFSGRDLTDEVLSHTRPEFRFVVAEQLFDPAVGTPAARLPAFAAIFRLKHPTDFDQVIEEAWQKAVGLISFTRGQQAMSGLIIDRVVHGETKFTFAYFSTAGVEDKTRLDQRFNFRPAVALPDDYVIFSSTETLARDLIDALKEDSPEAVGPLAGTHSVVEIDGGSLASALESNRDALVRQNMVNDGNTKEEAEASIDVLLTVVKSLGQMKLTIGTHESLTRARLEMKPTLP